MSTKAPGHGPKKRKQSASTPQQAVRRAKKPRPQEPQDRSKPQPQPQQQPQNGSLMAPHEPIVAELRPKYDILVASVISSTQIRKRVTHAVTHLVGDSTGAGTLPRVALLHARTADVCKLITVVEQCKRVLGEEGKIWWQYNQLFDLPRATKRKDVVEETVLENDAGDSGSDDFELMTSRFEKAVMPPAPTRTIRSMRVFISLVPIPELKSKKNVTVQSSEGKE